ncbi:ImmA/IrrE family metallo-endopeptidase [Pseudoclavibacter sp. Z016]|uniref:ImmA/IrrE family metallo-endopeptidase n=1 Tax=Pseudoclavibacter sp. Z016 TaxID=2080581 RepID=UPI000CE834EA|nr:ImmA/IrrE family metallo-endopeptidase [Pseudoclavibacter sp. Z016]PPF72607.1 hypothetical protein C5B99_17355 [Pseudoclavibacter sp. Z016]
MPLFTLAQLLGLEVFWRDDMADAGSWHPEQQAISLRSDLTETEVRSVLAHELGHAVLGHVCDGARAERAADEWAANMLLGAQMVADCAQRWPESPEKWCDELQVTPDILRAWMSQANNYALASEKLRLASA